MNTYIVENIHTSDVNKSFTEQSSMNDHLQIHSGACPYACDMYNKLFNVKYNACWFDSRSEDLGICEVYICEIL